MLTDSRFWIGVMVGFGGYYVLSKKSSMMAPKSK